LQSPQFFFFRLLPVSAENLCVVFIVSLLFFGQFFHLFSRSRQYFLPFSLCARVDAKRKGFAECVQCSALFLRDRGGIPVATRFLLVFVHYFLSSAVKKQETAHCCFHSLCSELLQTFNLLFLDLLASLSLFVQWFDPLKAVSTVGIL